MRKPPELTLSGASRLETDRLSLGAVQSDRVVVRPRMEPTASRLTATREGALQDTRNVPWGVHMRAVVLARVALATNDNQKHLGFLSPCVVVTTV